MVHRIGYTGKIRCIVKKLHVIAQSLDVFYIRCITRLVRDYLSVLTPPLTPKPRYKLEISIFFFSEKLNVTKCKLYGVNKLRGKMSNLRQNETKEKKNLNYKLQGSS